MDRPALAAPSPQPGLIAVLQAAAAELMDLAGVADGLGVCQAGNAEQWQSLDRMSQHLGELSVFLSAVSCTLPDLRPDFSDAFAAVRVDRLAKRLIASQPAVEAESGELELFGD